MGDEQLSYLGFSYGTVIGQVYADLFPDRVRSMVLDGVVELGPTGLESADEQAAGFETALARFAEYCDAAEGCATAGDTLEAVEEVLALAEEPGGIPVDGRRPHRRPGRGQPRHQLRAVLPEPLARPSATRSPTPSTATAAASSSSADGYLDIGAFEIYFAVNCLDFAWPTGDPDAFFAAGQGHRGGVAALRRGAGERLHALRELARAAGTARAGDRPGHPARSW